MEKPHIFTLSNDLAIHSKQKCHMLNQMSIDRTGSSVLYYYKNDNSINIELIQHMNIYSQIHRVPFWKADGSIPKLHDKY